MAIDINKLGEMGTRNKLLIAVIAMIAILLVGSFMYADAVHYINGSGNKATTNVLPLPTVTISANASSAYVGDTIQLTATLSQPINGVSINFLDNDTTVLGMVSTTNGVSVFLVTLGTVAFHNWNCTAIV